MENTDKNKENTKTKTLTNEDKKLCTNLNKIDKKICEVNTQRKSDNNLLKNKNNKKTSGRVRWSDHEKKLVLEYFKEHTRNKVTPKKEECEDFLKVKGEKMINKDWVRIKTFVYNFFRQK